MPSSRATARRDRPAAPSRARCLRATSVISPISSARTRSLAVRLAFMTSTITEHRNETRALLQVGSVADGACETREGLGQQPVPAGGGGVLGKRRAQED